MQFLLDCEKEDERKDPFNTSDPDWRYILDAAERDPLVRLRKFLALKKAYVSVSGRWDSKFGEYPGLHVAVKIENHAALRLLIKKGAWINGTSSDPAEQDTALHVAAKVGNLAAADILLDQGAKIEARNSQNETPLHS
jgi:hypothetical protein